MNTVILCGRLTADPKIAQKGETTIARYTLAVDRRTRDKQTDFISCVTFGKTAEFAQNYLHKGTKILVEGRIQTGSYTNKDGQKVYTTDVVVNSHEFVESKGSAPESKSSEEGGFMAIPDGIDEELPFN